MRNIYPKLIATLCLMLFAALVLKYADGDNKSTDNSSKTATIQKVAQKGM